MENQELENRIKNFDLRFIKYIDSETKEFGNKVILLSSMIVLVLFYKSSASEMDFTGIKLEIEKRTLLIILFVVNLYYLIQFIIAIKIDKLLVKIPYEFDQISNIIFEKFEKYQKEHLELKNRDSIENLTSEEMSNFFKKAEALENDNIGELIKEWKGKTNGAVNFLRWNKSLNIYFPLICYGISILVLIANLVMKYWV
jgi:hypothetical protein